MKITLTDKQILRLNEIYEENRESFLDECRGFLTGESFKKEVEKLIEQIGFEDTDKFRFNKNNYIQFLNKKLQGEKLQKLNEIIGMKIMEVFTNKIQDMEEKFYIYLETVLN